MKRLIKVVDDLYRGGAPSVRDVVDLHKHYDIQKIVSLDAQVAHRIHRITQLLNIEHVILPINGPDLEPLARLLSLNLEDLLLKGGPTYIHCLEGKDRTGMVVAMLQARYLGMPCNQAIKEAKAIGFGHGLNPHVVKLYEKLIRMYCEENHDHQAEDTNEADIVDNSRPGDDWRGSVLDSADMSSFAPYLDYTRQWPNQDTYNYRYDQWPTREEHGKNDPFGREEEIEDRVPMVGVYDANSGISGVGPVDNGGGFTAT